MQRTGRGNNSRLISAVGVEVGTMQRRVERKPITRSRHGHTSLFVSFPILLAILLSNSASALALGANKVVRVRYGYFNYAYPSVLACGRGWLNLNHSASENLPDYVVECFPQITGAVAVSRLDNAELDFASLGSTPWSQAVARGVDVKEIYVEHFLNELEGIYVRKDIQSPLDLVNKTIATPFGSTMHYQLLFFIDMFQLQGEIKVVDMSPVEIIEAWSDPNHIPIIDGAAIWGTAKSHILENEGMDLISSAVLTDWGAPTYTNLVTRRKFADEHPHFTRHVVGIISRLSDSFLDRLDGKDKKSAARWNLQKNNSMSYMGPLSDSLMRKGEEPGNPSKDILEASMNTLLTIDLLPTSQQLTCKYMGNTAGSCSRRTGQYLATVSAANFLLQHKELSTLGILGHNNDACNDSSSFCGGDIIDPTYLALARTENVSTPFSTTLGPYADVLHVDNDLEQTGPDAVLSALEARDLANGRSPYAAHEIGRILGNVTGDSNCTDSIINGASVLNGTFGDGANALPGRMYSDNKHCRWTIHPLNDGLVEVRIQRLRIWSGDMLRIYSGGSDCSSDKQMSLLAQLSGMYDNEELPGALPPFRSSSCIIVEFVSDEIHESTYAIGEEYGDGFEISFLRDNVPEDDCEEKDSDGLCLCSSNAWGGDCSHDAFCIGTKRVKIRDDGSPHHVLKSSSNATKEVLSFADDGSHFVIDQDHDYFYPNGLNCTYELDLGESSFDLVLVQLHFDLEETFDLLRLQTGSGENSTQYNMISGRHSKPGGQEYYVPVDENGMASLHLTTDDKGRRIGFYAEISGAYFLEPLFPDPISPICDEGRFGSHCESKYCLPHNTLHRNLQDIDSDYVAGRVTSQDKHSSIRSMPWAPDGGCAWEMGPSADSTGAIRLIMNRFDLEPYPASAIGDKVIFESSGVIHTELYVESCIDGTSCNHDWQTGECITSKGGCAIRNVIELDIGVDVNRVSIRLVTDRNDDGKNFSGVDFDVHFVQPCDCTSVVCDNNDFCTCDSIACSGCHICVDDVQSGFTTGTIIALISTLLALFILFLPYRQRKKRQIREQQAIIKRASLLMSRKNAELESFCLGTSKFGDAVAFIDSLLKPESPLVDPSEVENLILVKRCLVKGPDDKMHLPSNLANRRNAFIMREFAGVTTQPEPDRVLSRDIGDSRSQRRQLAFAGMSDYCLPEFENLDCSQQTDLFELLSLSSLSKWDFNIFDVSAIDEKNTLLFVAWAVIGSPHSQYAMAKALGGTSDLNPNGFGGYNFDMLDFDVDIETLCAYMRVIERDYNADNPYHNAIHAADVVQTLHSLIQMANDNAFEKEELFTILVASAVHDVKHPGMNNIFQVNTISNLALSHNDCSVLENEHSSHAFRVMVQCNPGEDSQLNFLQHAEPSKFAAIRRRIVQAVLHTDMSQHFATVAKIKSQAAGISWDIIDPNDRWDVLMYMLHLADISNPAKAHPMSLLWTDRCLQEFFAQGDKEREMGLPISPNCDALTTKKPDSQIGFINFVVKPAYLVLADIIPAVNMNILPVIESNLIYWEHQKGE